MVTACAPSQAAPPPPAGVSAPLAEARDIQTGFYREDSLDDIGATGRPQLLFFYALELEEGGCTGCDAVLPIVQKLESDYFERIDVVYLNWLDSVAVRDAMIQEYNLNVWTGEARYWYEPGLVFIAPDGEVIRTFRTRREESDFRATFDRYLGEQSAGS
jgi:thiol-disulfide isomerase/thioredoxin